MKGAHGQAALWSLSLSLSFSLSLSHTHSLALSFSLPIYLFFSLYCRFRAKRQHLIFFQVALPESEGQNLALTGVLRCKSLDSGPEKRSLGVLAFEIAPARETRNLSHRKYVLISSRKSTVPKYRSLVVYCY